MDSAHYDSVSKLVYYVTHKFHKQFGGDLTELQSEAHEHYTVAATKYDPQRSKYSTWIHYYIWYGLLKTYKRTKQRQITASQLPKDIIAPTHFNLKTFLEGLSNESKQVAHFALTSLNKRRGKHSKRRTIVNVLQHLGWSGQQIAKSFREIREALS